MGVTDPETWNWDKTDWHGAPAPVKSKRKANTKRRPYGNYAPGSGGYGICATAGKGGAAGQNGGYNVQQPRKPLPGEDHDIVDIGQLRIRKSDGVIIIRGEEIGNLKDIPKTVKKLKKKISKVLLKEN